MDSENTGKKSEHSTDIEIFKIVVNHLKQDTRDFWTRANFYLVAHAGLLSAFVISYPTLAEMNTAILMVIPVLGTLTATMWFFVLRGSIKWLQRWRDQAIKLDQELDRFRCYVEVETYAKQKPFSSPSYVTQFLPLIFIIGWLVIILLTLQ